jgi:hypothetical protein
MLAMRRSRREERSVLAENAERRDGVGGVCEREPP